MKTHEDTVSRLAELLELGLSGARPCGLDKDLIDLAGAKRVGDVMATLVRPDLTAISGG